MIRRFSSTSKVFFAKETNYGCELIWQTTIDLSHFKYMALIDFYTTSWPIVGKNLCHISSNLTESSNCNPDGHIFSWLKKAQIRAKGYFHPQSQTYIFFLEFYALDREFTDEVKFFVKNLKYSENLDVEIIVEFSNEKTALFA